MSDDVLGWKPYHLIKNKNRPATIIMLCKFHFGVFQVKSNKTENQMYQLLFDDYLLHYPNSH